jgi:hypothetical protein
MAEMKPVEDVIDIALAQEVIVPCHRKSLYTGACGKLWKHLRRRLAKQSRCLGVGDLYLW